MAGPHAEGNDPLDRIKTSANRAIQVFAGPGTGKTYALRQRAAWLIQTGTDPRRILAVTFTRTAARDLRRELDRIGAPGVEEVRAGTLHSFCFSLLSKGDVLEETGRVPRPLLVFEVRFLLEDLDNPTRFRGIRERRERLLAFNAAWARLLNEQPGWPDDPIDRQFHQTLLQWLTFHRALLIGELVPLALAFLRNNPASPHRRLFEHILVDEYQDLNRAEQVLIDLMAENAHIAVFGDENQSIYSFKYAHPEGVTTFSQTYPGAFEQALVECRRCPRHVVEMANHLIAQNPNPNPRQLVTHSQIPGEVYIVQWDGMEQEAEGISQFVQGRVINEQVGLGEILILTGRRQFGYALRDALNRRGILAHSFFLEQALDGDPTSATGHEAQEAFTLLTLLANENDRVALRCWCGFGSPSLRSGAWARLVQHCRETGGSPREVLAQQTKGVTRIPQTGGLLDRYRELLVRLDRLRDLRGDDLLNALFPPEQVWANPMQIVASSLGDISEAEPAVLKEDLQVAITQPELPTDVDYARVMSLHKAKGLTARIVIVVGCLEGILPHIDDRLPLADQERQLEEQRRLFYVAVTRTTNTLVVSSVLRLPRDAAYQMRVHVRPGRTMYAPTIASRFINELGPSRPAPIAGAEFLRRARG